MGSIVANTFVRNLCAKLGVALGRHSLSFVVLVVSVKCAVGMFSIMHYSYSKR